MTFFPSVHHRRPARFAAPVTIAARVQRQQRRALRANRIGPRAVRERHQRVDDRDGRGCRALRAQDGECFVTF